MVEKRTSGSFQMIMAFMRSYPRRSAMMLVCLLFAGLSEGVGIATFLPLLDLIVGGGSSSNTMLGRITREALAAVSLEPSLSILLSLIVAGITLKSGFTLLAMKQVGYTVAYVVTDFRLAMVRALLGARWDYFVSHQVGEFTNAISTEAIRLSKGYRLACTIISESIHVLFYIAIAALISWEVTLLSLFTGSVITFLLYPLVKMAKKAGQRQTESFQSLLPRLTDLLHGIKPIKAMARENQVRTLLDDESKNLKKALQQQVLSSEMLTILREPILILFMAIGIYFVLKHRSVPMANFMIMAFLFYRTVNRIGSVQKQVQTVATLESAYWSFRNKLKEVESAGEVLSGSIRPELNHQVAFENVCFSYGDKEILKNISFSIPYGKLTVITGISGAGKTTIADMLTGIVRPRVGDVLVDGIPFSQIDLRKWRQMIGYVPQEMFLFHETVYANVTLGEDTLTRQDVEEALIKAGALDFVSALPQGMDSVIGERGGKISGGQRQRISVARALVRKPRLLILDEVTTLLDPKTEAALCSTIFKLRGEMAILAISHQPTMVESADFVYRLDKGQIHLVEQQEKRSIGVMK